MTKTQKAAPDSEAVVDKKVIKSRSAKAGLIFPVSRVHKRVLSSLSSGVTRVSAGAPVFVAAISEYYMTEILQLAGDLVKRATPPRKRITPVDLLEVIRADKELNKATKGLRVLVGDRIRDASDTILTSAALKKKKEEVAERRAARMAD